MAKSEGLLSPVEAYNRIAPEFARLSAARRLYLKRVEQVIGSEIPRGKHSLLDVGAGNGRRAARIAAACGLDRLVLLEPSAEMRRHAPENAESWPIRAEELSTVQTAEFDVITCLWNVLGHIDPAENRMEVLRQCKRLIVPTGLIFIDVNHRYNLLEYGLLPTLGRLLLDWLKPNEHNGDVTAHWNVNGTPYTTSGHVFTDREIRKPAQGVGLVVKKMFAINYTSGEIQQQSFCGNLLYVLAKKAIT